MNKKLAKQLALRIIDGLPSEMTKDLGRTTEFVSMQMHILLNDEEFLNGKAIFVCFGSGGGLVKSEMPLKAFLKFMEETKE